MKVLYTQKVLEKMKVISMKFFGNGKNKVVFKSLDTPQKYTGNFRIEALNTCKITIGKIFFENFGILIHAANSEVVVEDDVMFANNVVIRTMNYHSIYQFDGKRLLNRNVYVGKHVWLGYGATLYVGSVIGGNIPNNCIAVGNPAKVVRKDIFWKWSGNSSDYYDLLENMRTVDEYIARTEENNKSEENINESSSSCSNEIK